MEITGGSVVLCFEDARLGQMVRDFAILAGVPPSGITLSGPGGAPNASLLLAQAGTSCSQMSPSQRLLRVGDRRAGPAVDADILLPDDGATLIALVRDHIERPRNAPCGVVLVGSWHGGGGATTSAFAVADALGGSVLDASPSLSFPATDGSGIDWDRVDPHDLPSGGALLAGLPRVQGVPVLTALAGVAPSPRDLRVAATAQVLPCPVAVDCGTNLPGLASLWDQLLESGQAVTVLLVGRATDRQAVACARALSLLSCGSGGPPLTALRLGRESRLFRIAQDQFPVEWRSAPWPGGRRGWKRLVANL